MSIRRYKVTRIDADYYTVSEEQLIKSLKVYRDSSGDFRYREVTRWESICSYGGQWPEDGIPEQAKDNNPRTLLKRNDESYTFYACVYHFPEPRLMGKWKDYTSASGWE